MAFRGQEEDTGLAAVPKPGCKTGLCSLRWALRDPQSRFSSVGAQDLQIALVHAEDTKRIVNHKHPPTRWLLINMMGPLWRSVPYGLEFRDTQKGLTPQGFSLIPPPPPPPPPRTPRTPKATSCQGQDGVHCHGSTECSRGRSCGQSHQAHREEKRGFGFGV